MAFKELLFPDQFFHREKRSRCEIWDPQGTKFSRRKWRYHRRLMPHIEQGQLPLSSWRSQLSRRFALCSSISAPPQTLPRHLAPCTTKKSYPFPASYNARLHCRPHALSGHFFRLTQFWAISTLCASKTRKAPFLPQTVPRHFDAACIKDISPFFLPHTVISHSSSRIHL